MATFQIPFGFAEDWRPSDREPIHIEQARAAAREAEVQEHLTLSLPRELSRSVSAAAAREGVSAHTWLLRAVARTVWG
jgi:predicted HicB family RNase H-like nuclease